MTLTLLRNFHCYSYTPKIPYWRFSINILSHKLIIYFPVPLFPTNHIYIRSTEWKYEEKKNCISSPLHHSIQLRIVIFIYVMNMMYEFELKKPSFNTWKCTTIWHPQCTLQHYFSQLCQKLIIKNIILSTQQPRRKSVLVRYQYLYSKSSHCWNRLMRFYFMVDIRTNSPKRLNSLHMKMSELKLDSSTEQRMRR